MNIAHNIKTKLKKVEQFLKIDSFINQTPS